MSGDGVLGETRRTLAGVKLLRDAADLDVALGRGRDVGEGDVLGERVSDLEGRHG